MAVLPFGADGSGERPTSGPGFVWLPAATFTMGSPATDVDRSADEGPQTQVTLTRGFFIGPHEVTQGEYPAVVGNNPSAFIGEPNRPVESVSWDEAKTYCAQLTVRERSEGRLPSGWAYRLPTEAEWEYARQAGSTNRFSYLREARIWERSGLHPARRPRMGHGQLRGRLSFCRREATEPLGGLPPVGQCLGVVLRSVWVLSRRKRDRSRKGRVRGIPGAPWRRDSVRQGFRAVSVLICPDRGSSWPPSLRHDTA